MHFPWFKRTGFFYYPVRLPGFLLLLAAISFAVYVFIYIDSRSHSVSDTLRNFFVWLLIIGVLYTFIGWITSGKENK
jgi:hypothetical protein